MSQSFRGTPRGGNGSGGRGGNPTINFNDAGDDDLNLDNSADESAAENPPALKLAIQLFLHKNAQPMSSTFTRLRHIQNFHINSVHSLKDVQNTITVNTLYFMVALGADIISDATFINMFTHNAFVILFWIVFLTGSSTLLLYDGATRVWGAIEDFKDYHAYHQANDFDEDE